MTASAVWNMDWHHSQDALSNAAYYDSYRSDPRGPPPPAYYPPSGGTPPTPRHAHQQNHHDASYWYEPPHRGGYGPPPPPHEASYGDERQGPIPLAPYQVTTGDGYTPESYRGGSTAAGSALKSPYSVPPPDYYTYYPRSSRAETLPSLSSSRDEAGVYPHLEHHPMHYRTPMRRGDPMELVQTPSESSKDDGMMLQHHQAPQEHPTQKYDESADYDEENEEEKRERIDEDRDNDEEEEKGEKKDGDSLALLANVSSAMAPPKSRKAQAKQQQEAKKTITLTSPSLKGGGPSSPLQRRLRSSPIITPNSGGSSATQVRNPTSSTHIASGPPTHYPPPPAMREYPTVTPKPITPTGASHYYGPPTHTSGHPGFDAPEGRGGPPPPPHYQQGYYSNVMPPRAGYHNVGYDSRGGSWEHPSPNLVENRNSFDSDSSGSRTQNNGAYPPHYPSSYDAAWHHDRHARGWYDRSGYGPHLPSYPPPHFQSYYEHDHYYSQRPPLPPPPPYAAAVAAPYTYVQQPNPDEKTLLRKKFSWKNFPELERFLIDNRDEYLKYSSRNYTVEQKQFNNMLTERLIELAEKHSYVFDPDDFNFVAIRDRIRCYYKSYVQTARKRGLLLPADKAKAERERLEEASRREAAKEKNKQQKDEQKQATSQSSDAIQTETQDQEVRE